MWRIPLVDSKIMHGFGSEFTVVQNHVKNEVVRWCCTVEATVPEWSWRSLTHHTPSGSPQQGPRSRPMAALSLSHFLSLSLHSQAHWAGLGSRRSSLSHTQSHPHQHSPCTDTTPSREDAGVGLAAGPAPTLPSSYAVPVGRVHSARSTSTWR